MVVGSGWIEARDTCSASDNYGELVVPGVTTGDNLPHGTKIDIVTRGTDWTGISLNGEERYVQTVYVVYYDPAVDIAPALGLRYRELC